MGGCLRVEAPPPGPSPPPSCPDRNQDKGALSRAWHSLAGGRGGCPALVCCVGAGAGVWGGQSGPTRSLSPSLQLSLSPHLTRCVSASLVLLSYCLSHLGVCGPSRSVPLSLWVSPPSLRQSFGLFLAVSGREDPSPQLQPLPGSHPPPAHLASGQGH